MISVGRMAEKYGMLPHEVKARATTYDIMITDVLATYLAYEQAKSEGKVDPSIYGLSENDMKQMLENANGR
jgi:hypothetical protein